MNPFRIYNREYVLDALWSSLCDIPDFVTKSRRLKLWSELQPEQKPALYMISKNQNRTNNQQNRPGTLLLDVELYIYVYNSDPVNGPQPMLNRMLDLVERKLDPGPAATYQTLGITNVHHCYVNGIIETDEGSLGQDAVAIVPIEILLT